MESTSATTSGGAESVTGAGSRLFDEHDLPILDDRNKAPIGELLRKFRFDHVDAAPDNSNVEEFWPDKVLQRILSRDRIRSTGPLADAVLGQSPNSQGDKYIKVMALLCLLGHESEIKDWVKSKISDSSFPFMLKDRKLCDRNGLPLNFVQHWSEPERESWVRKQWSVCVPKFRLDRNGKAIHHKFHRGTMLPWRRLTQEDHLSWEASDRAEGDYAIVQGVMIPKSSHEFDSVLRKLRLKPNGFALKAIKPTPLRDVVDPALKALYETEVAHHSHWNTIFASCFPTQIAICRPTGPPDNGNRYVTSSIQNGSLGNYLVLPMRDADKYGILVLSGMGSSTFHGEGSMSKQPSRLVSQVGGYYGPPELGLPHGEVDTSFDIWSLGCVYLEMITWALGGHKYLFDFKEARLAEKDTDLDLQTSFFYKVFRDVDFEVREDEPAIVKKGVVEWMNHLHGHKYCTHFIDTVLDTIETQMLVVAWDGDSPKRSSAEVLGTIFEDLTRLGDEDYMPKQGSSSDSRTKERVPEAGVKVEVAEERANDDVEMEVKVDNDDNKTKDTIPAVSADVSAPSPSSTQTDEEQLELLVQDLATFLQQEKRLAPLFQEAISVVRPDLFETKVTTLLAGYSRILEKGASPGIQSKAASFVWKYRLQTAKKIRAQMSSVDSPASRTLELDPNDAVSEAFDEIREFLSSAQAIESFRREFRQWLNLYLGTEEDHKRQEGVNPIPSVTVLARNDPIQRQGWYKNLPSESDYNSADIGGNYQGVEYMESSGGKSLREDEERRLSAASMSETIGSYDSESPENLATKQKETVPAPPVSAETLSPRSLHIKQWQKLCLGLFSYRPRNLACLLDDIVYMLLFRQTLSYLLAPRVPAGKTRIWWRCADFHAKSCGEVIFDDVCMPTTGTGQRDNDTRPGFQQLDLEQGPSSSQEQSSSNWVLNSCTSLLGSLKRLYGQPMKIQEQPAPNGHRPPAPSDLPGDLFLFLLCIGNEGELTLHKVSLGKCKTDKELFNLLNEQYYSVQSSNRGWLTLKTLKKISLVRFQLDVYGNPNAHTDDRDYRCRRSVRHHTELPEECDCFPPKGSEEYHCTPVPNRPPRLHPDIMSGYLTHYFESPHSCTRDRYYYLHQLPKHKGRDLMIPPDGYAVGWGLYFEEGQGYRNAFIIFWVLSVAAFCVSAVSAIEKKDPSLMTTAIMGTAGAVLTIAGLLAKSS
ncbi:protein kinase [Apiospora saccharicola]|uniref:Protein kinase n=1 Tax=Apiospora saccharicola TaxID=335842 RepID=A0ABR1WGM2_9PEZI